MVKVKKNSEKIFKKGGRGKNVRGNYEITLIYVPADIKSFLKDYLKELRDYDIPNRFTQKELIELFSKRVFTLVPSIEADRMAEWAFDIGLKIGYFTTNRWDRQKPTIYFIDKEKVNIQTGPKTKKNVDNYEENE
jgi:hypothetical protein